MNSVLVCPYCKAKLKVKPASLKVIKKIKCVKCGKTFPVSPEMKSLSISSASGQESPIQAVNKAPEPAESMTPPLQSEEISFVCPKCGRDLKIQKSMAGQKVKCKKCGTITTVPQDESNAMNLEHLKKSINDSSTIIAALSENADHILDIGAAIVEALKSGCKVLTAGNGGSAAEAMHMAEELVGRFRANRVSLPGISLAADSTALTCIGNDFGFDAIFSRQIEGLGKPGDILVLFSTSGNASNLKSALDAAHAIGMKTVCLLGRDGGLLAGLGDYEIIVAGKATERIQEAHQVMLHLILDIIEEEFTKLT